MAYPLDGDPSDLGSREDLQIEWKWDWHFARTDSSRRRGTSLRRAARKLVTAVYPEIAGLGRLIPSGTVLDGEILAWQDDRPFSFNVLQQRIGRKQVDSAILADAPVILMLS